MAENLWSNLRKVAGNYFSMSPYLVTQQEAEQSIREGVSFRGTNLLILVFAIFIASLGLNTNSTAVIIGAMLISPLMGPIIGIGLGIGITDFELLKRSARNLIVAALFSMLASCLYFLISPVAEGHSELLARTSPTIYDVLIGFFGGGAGIVAIGSRSKGNVIPGVAIATALMPPLCTAGYGLATWQMQYFFGATYLFLINSIFICLATFIGIKVMKFKPIESANPIRAAKIRKLVYALAILTLLPSIYLTYNMLQESRFEINADRFIKEECQWPDTYVLSSSEQWAKKNPTINITLIGKPQPHDSLMTALSSRLRFYGLQGVNLRIFQGESQANNPAMAKSDVEDLYQVSQRALQVKQTEIDSLRSVLSAESWRHATTLEMLPELKVVFPQLKEIAVTRAIFANPHTGLRDTLNVAMIEESGHLSGSRRKELQRYLEARLKLEEIRVINAH